MELLREEMELLREEMDPVENDLSISSIEDDDICEDTSDCSSIAGNPIFEREAISVDNPADNDMAYYRSAAEALVAHDSAFEVNLSRDVSMNITGSSVDEANLEYRPMHNSRDNDRLETSRVLDELEVSDELNASFSNALSVREHEFTASESESEPELTDSESESEPESTESEHFNADPTEEIERPLYHGSSISRRDSISLISAALVKCGASRDGCRMLFKVLQHILPDGNTMPSWSTVRGFSPAHQLRCLLFAIMMMLWDRYLGKLLRGRTNPKR